jgi:hypothetical protein
LNTYSILASTGAPGIMNKTGVFLMEFYSRRGKQTNLNKYEICYIVIIAQNENKEM